MEMLSNISSVEGLTLPQDKNRANNSDLGQEDFLKLMITQFRNQDPMKPMENGEFLGQLAQFSTVSGIAEMNGAVVSLADSIQASQALQAAGMVGRTVLVESDTGRLREAGVVDGAVDVPQGARAVSVQVLDATGQLVRQISLGPRPGGLAEFQWDGLTSTGGQAPPGDYRLVAQTEVDGGTLAVPTLVSSRVASISLSPSDGPSITTENGEHMALSSVRSIR